MPVPLTSLPWLLPTDWPRSTLETFLISSLLYVWDKVITTYNVSSRPGPLTPILVKPRFPPGMSDKSFLCWQPPHPSLICHSCTDIGLKTLGELSSRSHPKAGEWLQYFQLRNFYKGLKVLTLCRDLTQFEELCLSDSKCPHALSKIYGIPISHAFLDRPFYVRDWERD